MFFVTNDNSAGQLLHLQQQIDELRAEIERLKAAAPEQPPNAEFDRREYMRDYMRRRRAEKKAQAE